MHQKWSKLKYFSVFFLTSTAILASACGSGDFNQASNDFMFNISIYSKDKSNDELLNKYFDNVNQAVATLQQQDRSYYQNKINVKYAEVNDENTKINNINSHKANFTYLTAKTTTYAQNPTFVPYSQTLTTAFKHDDDPNLADTWENLNKIAQKENTLFNETPYQQWNNQTHDWNGFRYNKFYNTNQLISHYRGVIYIWGSETDISGIKSAWANKNWNKFLSYGIMTGKTGSAGKFLLQENLLKEHFGEHINLRAKHPNILHNQKGYNLGKENLKNYKIVFDDDTSYAWINNNLDDTKNKTKNFEYTATDTNNKMEVFKVTKKNLYDIGVFSSNVPTTLQRLMFDALMLVHKNGQDQYGPSVGYNGYQKINDVETELYSVVRNALRQAE